MHILSITLVGYRQFLEPLTLELPEGIIGICGPNGVGKSKLVEAIGFALYGSGRGSILPKKDKVTDIASKAGKDVVPIVTLNFELNGQIYHLVRSTSSKLCALRQEGIHEPLATTSKAVTSKVIELLQLTPDAFLGTFVARQRDIASLQSMENKTRQRLVNRLIGIALLETAESLAQDRRTSARVAHETARSTAGETVTSVQERLDGLRETHLTAELDASTAQSNYDDALAVENDAQIHWLAMKEIAEKHTLKQKQIEGIEQVIKTLAETLSGADIRLTRAEDAEALLDEAQIVLDEMEDVEDAITRHLFLKGLTTDREILEGHQAELAEVEIKIEERERILDEQAIAESQVDLLKQQIQGYVHPLAVLQHEMSQALADKEKARRRKATVSEMGADGPCDRCGQALGASIAQAIEHLDSEISDATLRSVTARTTIAEQTDAKQLVQDELDDASTILEQIKANAQPYANTAGEQVQLKRQVDTVRRSIADKLVGMQDGKYDSDAHLHDTARQSRKSQAQQTVTANQSVAAQADAIRLEIQEYHIDLAERRQEVADLRAEIEELAYDPESVSEAKRVHSEACDSSADLMSALGLAQREATRTSTLIGSTEADLAQARKRWQSVDNLRTQFSVTERTAELIQELKVEISSEARPRITELMQGWAQALMGPHFQHIELSDDYRIQADNGSGVHEIEHFSGGEQTLLAIMLRVAISLYCQERAGYPAGVLILDEVFGDQDETHRTQLVQFLEEIRPNYHQILIINHVTEVTEMLDSIITVSHTGERTSTAAFRL